MSINRVVVSGNLTRDPELRSTGSGMSILKMGLAVNDRVKENGEWTDRPNFFDVTVFGARAESLSRFLSKGSKVAVEGKLRWSQWEKDGEKRSKVEIIADDIEFMTAAGTSRESAPSRGSGYEPEDDIPFAVLPTERRAISRDGHMRY